MSPRTISQKEMEAVLRLSGPERYDHFVKHVVDCQQAWGLWNEGWAMGKDDSGRLTLQLWPAREYAALSAVDGWSDYEPSEIPLEDLVNELLPNLQKDGIQPSVFRTREGDAVMPRVSQLLADLKQEMSRYE
jgi:hypothetical protein